MATMTASFVLSGGNLQWGEGSPKDKELDLDSHKHLAKACHGTKVKPDSICLIQYPPGWHGLVGDFIKEISHMHCALEKVSMSYGYLDVVFRTNTLTNEDRIWCSVDYYRRKLHEVCGKCGAPTHFQRRLGWKQVCETCIVTTEAGGATGTWLDNY
jgi:hypothetical protein